MFETIYGRTDRQVISARKRRPLHKTTKQFIEEATKIHGGKYDYSQTTYNGSHYFVTIVCPEHGPFEQMAKEHFRYGCKKCAIESHPLLQKYSTKKFIELAQSKHGTRYDYSKVMYAGTDTQVEIVCQKHRSFFQTPHDHYSSGAGCPKCMERLGGYSYWRFQRDPDLANQQGTLYLVHLTTPEDAALKIGVTKMTVKQRFSTRPYPYKVTPIIEIRNTLQNVFVHEQQILKQFSYHQYRPNWVLDGRTECFHIEALLGLCEAIDDWSPAALASSSGVTDM